MLSVILPSVVVVVVAMVVALVPGRPINSNSTTGCLINTFEVSAPSEVPVLAYISEASPAVVMVLYKDLDDGDVRDAVTLTNTMAEHSKVRDRKSTKNSKSLSRQIPEGWNTFTLVVAGGNLTIKLVLSEEDHVDLYTLALKKNDTVWKMHVEGNVSNCDQVSPEWHVKVGKEVTLLFQPIYKDRYLEQLVKVSPRGSAAPYVTFPTSRNTKTPIPADTTLRVAISLRDTHALLRLFMHGDDDDDGKEIVSISVPVALPLLMVVGCRDGGDGGGATTTITTTTNGGGDGVDNGVHLRLMLSQPQPDKNVTAMNSVSPDTASAWITRTLVGSLAVVVVVIIVIVAVVDVTNLRPWTKRLVERILSKSSPKSSPVCFSKSSENDPSPNEENDPSPNEENDPSPNEENEPRYEKETPSEESHNIRCSACMSMMSQESQDPWEDLGIQVTYGITVIIKEVSVTLSVDVKMQEVLDKLKQHATIETIVVALALRRERRLRDRLDLLALSDTDLLDNYRFPRHDLIELIQELEPALGRRTRRANAIPTQTQVLVALRFFASGSFQNIVGDIGGPSQAAVSRIIRDVTNALSNKAVEEIRMPSTAQDLSVSAQTFRRMRNFPRVIGALDCTHFAIKGPSVDENIYVNRKRYHSMNVQVVCDAAKLIISFCARFPGSTHDSFIWNNCALRQRFDRGDFGNYLLLGDTGYALESFLMTPVTHPTTVPEERYNRGHCRTRVTVEQTFGILKSRFRCLHKSGGALQYTPLKCCKIIASCLLLHNRCVRRRIPEPQQLEDDDQPDVAPVPGRANRGTGRAVQLEIIQNYYS